jgi:hypothetical protein
MDAEKEKKPSVTTVTKLANAIGVFVAVLGVVFVIANLIGFTDIDWLRVGPLFVIPCAIFISNKHEKRKYYGKL